MSKRSRQQRRALQREFLMKTEREKNLIRDTATIRESGYCWLRRWWESYFCWRRFGAGRWASLYRGWKVANMETI